jgi:uncharacterized protein YgiM (DUF1202 family)
MIHNRRLYICISVAVALLIVSACKGKDSPPKPQELPDLNAQIRSYVTVENTAVRAGPGSQFRAIAQIRRDAKVQAVGRDGDWLLIVSKKGNPPGYIDMASVKPGSGQEQEAAATPMEGKYETLVDTQVRSGPGLHYPVVAKVKKGMKVNVVNEEKGWLKVESKRGNPPGYLEATLARPVGNQQNTER